MRVGYTTLRVNSISRNDPIAALFRSKIDPNVDGAKMSAASSPKTATAQVPPTSAFSSDAFLKDEDRYDR